MERDIGAYLSGIIIIGVLFVLVRPNSKGPQLVQTVGTAMTGLLHAATGGGAFTSSGK